MRQAAVLVYSSPNGKTGWTLVKPEDVPDWVKRPDVMARLIRGETAQNNHAGLALPAHLGLALWYRVEKVPDQGEAKRIVQAREKRLRRNQRNLRLVH